MAAGAYFIGRNYMSEKYDDALQAIITINEILSKFREKYSKLAPSFR